MEKSIPEFDGYISELSSSLNLDTAVKEEICMEVSQNLLDKYNEYLIKGYDLEDSIWYTLRIFENPKKLAEMFNKIYREDQAMTRIKDVMYNKKIIFASFIFIFLATIFSFYIALNDFLPILGVDYGKRGWHDINNNIFNGLVLSISFLIMYGTCLYNMFINKVLPPKVIIWTAYINIFLVLLFDFLTH